MQNCLKRQFSVSGLQPTIRKSDLSLTKVPDNKKYVQILHINGNHWVTVSNINAFTSKVKNDRVFIYDSMFFNTITLDLKKKICSLVRPEKDKFEFVAMDILQQSNNNDCGLHAIANTVEILHGFDPVDSNFNTRIMRKHLLQCLDNGIITRFPQLGKCRKRYVNAEKLVVKENISCDCRMPSEQTSEDLIKCSLCHKDLRSSSANTKQHLQTSAKTITKLVSFSIYAVCLFVFFNDSVTKIFVT